MREAGASRPVTSLSRHELACRILEYRGSGLSSNETNRTLQ